MDRFTALSVFRHAVELGSFAAASRHLGLSPAAVSKNIGELEAHLGVRLLHRTTRRMSLTEAGELYYERVARVLDDLDDAAGMLDAMQGEAKGLLRVSAPMSLTLTCFASAIPAFLRRHPELSLDLRLDDRRVNLVEEGFDLAIRGTEQLEDSSLVARKLMTLEHVVCAAPDYLERVGAPTHPEELATHECVRFSLAGHAKEWSFTKGGRELRQRIGGRYQVTSSLAVRGALREGLGLALIPRVYVREDLACGRLQTVLDDWRPQHATLFAVYPSKQYLVPKVRAFVDFLVARIEELGETPGTTRSGGS